MIHGVSQPFFRKEGGGVYVNPALRLDASRLVRPYGSAEAMSNTARSGDKPVLYLKLEEALPLSAAGVVVVVGVMFLVA
jgi:hypothetical protein